MYGLIEQPTRKMKGIVEAGNLQVVPSLSKTMWKQRIIITLTHQTHSRTMWT